MKPPSGRTRSRPLGLPGGPARKPAGAIESQRCSNLLVWACRDGGCGTGETRCAGHRVEFGPAAGGRRVYRGAAGAGARGQEPTLLAEELQHDGALSETGIERATIAVTRAVGQAVRLGVDHLYPFVTAAIRDATNRDEVIDRIEAASGIRPQFLSGEEEARLTYFAVRRWYGWSAGRLLLIDIGGGSMELVLGRDVEPELAISLPLGAGRRTPEFLTADPPTGKQVKRLRRHVQDTLAEVLDRLRWGDRLRNDLSRAARAWAGPRGPTSRGNSGRSRRQQRPRRAAASAGRTAEGGHTSLKGNASVPRAFAPPVVI
ncbi:hypothetical protein [Amycolatopsis sp. DSM 110486]|uniref:Ppx/GppA phosphatase family protein n=1 Tax=Amycolatopsis sp. DSM 110486 TaxID=2865832 RepID=UPI002103ECB0|nr:hypothetical protein [Amycolatopsis sp. DSM 110486]